MNASTRAQYENKNTHTTQAVKRCDYVSEIRDQEAKWKNHINVTRNGSPGSHMLQAGHKVTETSCFPYCYRSGQLILPSSVLHTQGTIQTSSQTYKMNTSTRTQAWTQALVKDNEDANPYLSSLTKAPALICQWGGTRIWQGTSSKNLLGWAILSIFTL